MQLAGSVADDQRRAGVSLSLSDGLDSLSRVSTQCDLSNIDEMCIRDRFMSFWNTRIFVHRAVWFLSLGEFCKKFIAGCFFTEM